MKKIILTILSFSYFLAGFAQFENYDLSKYKLADYQFQALTTSFQANGDYQKSANPAAPNVDNWANYFTARTTSRFQQLQNSRAQQTRKSVYLNLRFTSRDEKAQDSDLGFTGNVSSDFDRRFYKSNGWFSSFGTQFNGYASAGNNVNEYLNLNFSVPLSIGFGRIENVTDAWQGIRILDDLNKFGLLTSAPTDEQILDLAEFVTQRQRLRFFDSRYKRIEDIETLDAFLEGAGLVGERNARYFNSLYDRWMFGVNEQRGAGQVIRFGISPTVGYTDFFNNSSNFKRYGGSAFVQYDYRKPINLKWQFNGSAMVQYGVNYDDDSNPSTDSGDGYLVPALHASVGWYPNTRTTVSVAWNAGYRFADDGRQSFNVYSTGFEQNLFFLNLSEGFATNFKTSANYYISPQTRFSGSVSFDYVEHNSSANCLIGTGTFPDPFARLPRCFNLNYGVQLTHSFF